MAKGTILYVGGFELPNKNAAAHRVLSNGKIFRELGYKVVFIDVDKTLRFDTDISTTLKNIQDFDCWSVPYPRTLIQWAAYLTQIAHIKNVLSKYDDVIAIIAYNYQSIALQRLKNLATRNNMKMISDCTEWYSTKGFNLVFKFVKGFDSFLRMRIIHKKMDGLIVISEFLKNYYNECKNIVCIPPLVDLDENKWKYNKVINSNSKLSLVYSGSPGKNKDKLDLLLESLYRLYSFNNYVFKVIGITKEEYLLLNPGHDKILNSLEDKVKFCGRISHIDSLQELKISDYSIFIRENTRLNNAGFPTKFVESISSGVPVITTRTSDLEKYIDEGKNGWFISYENKELMDKEISKILKTSPENVKEMKEECRGSKMFHYVKFTESTGKFLEQIFK